MKTYDISVPIRTDMPVWPGDPAVSMQRVAKIEEGDNKLALYLNIAKSLPIALLFFFGSAWMASQISSVLG